MDIVALFVMGLNVSMCSLNKRHESRGGYEGLRKGPVGKGWGSKCERINTIKIAYIHIQLYIYENFINSLL
jgi:hypothetical protein